MVIFYIISVKSALAAESDSSTEMPKACQNIDLTSMTFELPLLTQELTQEQKKKIQKIIVEARIQTCILQMQHDGLLQQMIAIIFEDNGITNQQLKPFYDQLLSLTQNRIENNIKTVVAIYKILSEKEWKIVISANTDYVAIKNTFIKQQIGLQQSYDSLISRDNPSEFTPLAIIPSFVCAGNSPKIKILEQIISKLSLTNSQEGAFRNIMRLQESQSCTARQDMNQFSEKLFNVIAMKPDQVQENQYKQIVNQLISKAYLLEYYEIEALSSLFKIVTLEQKKQIRESYMIVKGML